VLNVHGHQLRGVAKPLGYCITMDNTGTVVMQYRDFSSANWEPVDGGMPLFHEYPTGSPPRAPDCLEDEQDSAQKQVCPLPLYLGTISPPSHCLRV
jgi:hypothetical protein